MVEWFDGIVLLRHSVDVSFLFNTFFDICTFFSNYFTLSPPLRNYYDVCKKSILPTEFNTYYAKIAHTHILRHSILLSNDRVYTHHLPVDCIRAKLLTSVLIARRSSPAKNISQITSGENSRSTKSC